VINLIVPSQYKEEVDANTFSFWKVHFYLTLLCPDINSEKYAGALPTPNMFL